MTPAALADAIREDAIDLLVDLTLHMDGERLETFARKRAPLQINYLSYPATSGLAAFDYRISCPLLDPLSLATSVEKPTPIDEPEKLIRLPETFWCYPRDTPPVPTSAPPAGATGTLTFGSFNSGYKVRDAALRTWSKILERVPNSRLRLLMRGGTYARSFETRLIRCGIDPARVTLLDYASLDQHLARLDQIDVFLDTFPYGGHTTLHDAIWMGIATVTLAGDSAISRASSCILHHVGLDDLVARDLGDYIELAVNLANDGPRRAELRRTLRSKMLESPLTDAPRFTRNLEAGYRIAWQRWCAAILVEDINIART